MFFICASGEPIRFERLGYLFLICVLAACSFLRNVLAWEVTYISFAHATRHKLSIQNTYFVIHKVQKYIDTIIIIVQKFR